MLAFHQVSRTTHAISISVESGKAGRAYTFTHLTLSQVLLGHAVSPNGRYLAVFMGRKHTIDVIDLETEKTVGKIPLPKLHGLSSVSFQGLAFSNDGKNLAGLYRDTTVLRLINWDIADGRQSESIPVNRHDKTIRLRQRAPWQFRVQFLPDQTGWLVYGTALIKRGSRSIKTAASVPANVLAPIRLIDDQRVLRMSDDGSQVASANIMGQRIETVNSKLEAADLPAIKRGNRNGVKTIELNDKMVAWTVQPDPLPKTNKQLTSEPIRLGAGLLHGADFSGAEAARLITSQSTHPDDDDIFRRNDARKAKDRRQRLSVHDLVTNSIVKEIDLPRMYHLLAVSPSGRLAALRTVQDRSRIEVWSLDTGKIQLTWKPYNTLVVSDPSRWKGKPNHPIGVNWIRFIDDDHLITRNYGQFGEGGRGNKCLFITWKIPECRAVYEVTLEGPEDHERRFAGLSPGRRYFVVGGKQQLSFLNSTTGQLQGTLKLPDGYRAAWGLGFHPDGTRCIAIVSHRRGGSYIRRTETMAAVWNLKDGKRLMHFQAPLPKRVTAIQWFPSRSNLLYVHANGGSLLDLDRRAVIWKYRAAGHTFTSTPDGRLWLRHTRTYQNKPHYVIAPVELSHAAAEKIAAEKMPNGRVALLEAGMKVSLQIGKTKGTSPDFAQKLRTTLTARLSKFGISVEPNASVVLKTEMNVASTETVLYTETTSFSRFRSRGIPTGKTVSYTATTYNLRMSLVNAQGTVIWQEKHTCSDEPTGGKLADGKDPAVHLREQGLWKLKSHVEDFFLQDGPPSSIHFQPKTANQLGFGSSSFDSSILEVTSLAGLPKGVTGTRVQSAKTSEKTPESNAPPIAVKKPRPVISKFDKACRAYVGYVYADLLGEDKSTWQTKLKWCPVLQRPVLGLRWGFGAQFSGSKPITAIINPLPTNVILKKMLSSLTAGVGPKLINQMKSKSDSFGAWPDLGDRRVSQPVLIGGGSRQELLDGAKSVGLDFIVVTSFASTRVGKKRETSMMVRILDVDTGKQLFGSARLKGSQLQRSGESLGDDVWLPRL